jgi:hypothetical protein
MFDRNEELLRILEKGVMFEVSAFWKLGVDKVWTSKITIVRTMLAVESLQCPKIIFTN